MPYFADIDDLPDEKQQAQPQNSYDLAHSGESLQLVASPGTAGRVHYQGHTATTIQMAKTTLHTKRTTDYTRVHAPNTVSQQTVMAPQQSEQFNCSKQLLNTYQTRTDQWQTEQQHETVLSQHTVENHLQTYQLHVPGALTESTSQHALQASKLKHSIQNQTIHAGTLKHQAKLTQIRGEHATIRASHVQFGGDKLVLIDGDGLECRAETPFERFLAKPAPYFHTERSGAFYPKDYHYWIVDHPIQLSSIGQKLYGEYSGPDSRYHEFTKLNEGIAPRQAMPGQFLYVPPSNGQPKRPLIADTLDQMNAQWQTLSPKEQSNLGFWHALGGAGLLTAISTGEIARSYLEAARKPIEAALLDIAHYGKLAKAASKRGDKEALRAARAGIQQAAQALDEHIHAFVRTLAKLPDSVASEFKDGTEARWHRQALDLKRAGVRPAVVEDIHQFHQTALKSSKIITAAGGVMIALQVGSAAAEIAETCKEHPEGKLCYKAGVTQTTETAGDIFGSGAAAAALRLSGAETLVCNLLLDEETAGTGFLVCKVLVSAVTVVGAGQVVGTGGEYVGNRIFEGVYNSPIAAEFR